jgi:hypothetical protein
MPFADLPTGFAHADDGGIAPQGHDTAGVAEGQRPGGTPPQRLQQAQRLQPAERPGPWQQRAVREHGADRRWPGRCAAFAGGHLVDSLGVRIWGWHPYVAELYTGGLAVAIAQLAMLYTASNFREPTLVEATADVSAHCCLWHHH